MPCRVARYRRHWEEWRTVDRDGIIERSLARPFPAKTALLAAGT